VALCVPQVGLTVTSLGRQTQLEVTILIGKNNQVCSLLKYVPVQSIICPTAMLLMFYLLGVKQAAPHGAFGGRSRTLSFICRPLG